MANEYYNYHFLSNYVHKLDMNANILQLKKSGYLSICCIAMIIFQIQQNVSPFKHKTPSKGLEVWDYSNKTCHVWIHKLTHN